ncbi:MAG: D-alanine--D-alanine ligase, partial [Flavobacteriaceae bacterium]|nr:D-alanine--D-alanine ligase [Flavobacteriaceae bacterium]
MKKTIAVIMGGYTSEFEISLKSGSVVAAHLDPEKYEVYPIVISKNRWTYTTDQGAVYPIQKGNFSLELPHKQVLFDGVFNAIHGSPGEDGKIQAYLELLGIPQTACNFYQAALTYNKRDLLSVLKPYGMAMAKSYYLNYGDPINHEAIIQKVGLPCFVKANRSGSSFGISKVYAIEQMEAALEIAFKEDKEVIIEEALVGREVSVGVIQYQGKTKVLPITEILSENDFFDYQAKYEGKSTEITPATLDPEVEQNIIDAAAFIYNTLKLKGFTRSEFILVNNVPHLLEVNTTPGMTQHSILPQQAKEAGISLP